MTPQQLIGVGVRLFALWLLLKSIPYLMVIPRQISAAPIPGTEGATAVAYVVGVVYVVVALLLWFFPMVVAHKLLPRTHHTDHLSFQARELARVGCGLLGLWLFAVELPEMTWFLFRALLLVDSASSFSGLDAEAKLRLAVSAAELAFAVLLIAKAGFFARLIAKEPEPPSAPTEDAERE